MTIAQHLYEADLKLSTPWGLNDEQLALWNKAYGPKNEAFRKAKLEGKALVRHARKMYREGKHSAAFESYRLAIRVLTPQLRDLAAAEFKRTFGSSADQALRMSTLRR